MAFNCDWKGVLGHHNESFPITDFEATADAGDKGKLYINCSTPEFSERNFAMVLKWSLHRH